MYEALRLLSWPASQGARLPIQSRERLNLVGSEQPGKVSMHDWKRQTVANWQQLPTGNSSSSPDSLDGNLLRVFPNAWELGGRSSHQLDRLQAVLEQNFGTRRLTRAKSHLWNSCSLVVLPRLTLGRQSATRRAMSATIAEPREQEVPCVLNFAVNQER